jgi:hypothetical protein
LGPEIAETVAGQDLATRIEAKIKNDTKQSRKMPHFELGPASIGAVAKSEATHTSILRKSGVARGWEALPMTLRGAI